MNSPREIRRSMTLDREDTLLLIIDIQEKLAGAMDESAMEEMQEGVSRLVEGCKILDIPILMTEQYPKGLGSTVAWLKELLPEDVQPISKVHFSCRDVPEVMDALSALQRKKIILVGLETHICLYQTARDFLDEGFDVFVPSDGVLSRFEENYDVGLDLLDKAGVTITTVETILFDLLKKSGTPEFKAISQLIK